MKRREFLERALAGAVAGGAVLAGCGGERAKGGGAPAVHTRPHVRWRLASSFPRSLDTLFGAAEILAERLKALTDGRFEVRPYPAGELVPGLQVLDAVQQGTVQAGHTAGYYYTGKNPALAFDSCVPFGLTARQQIAWFNEAGGLKLIRDLYADFGVTSFPGGNTGVQMGGWFKRPVPDAASLKGLKMRIPGLGGQVMSRLGVTVQVLAGGDIYPALERGAIDATEWVGPYDDEKLGFHKVAKLYYYPGWWEPGPSLSFLVNRNAWGKLPSDYRSAFEVAARDAAVAVQARYDARNPAALRRILASGVKLVPFSDDIIEAARRASAELLDEQAAADAGYKKVYDHWKKFRDEVTSWFATAEYAYVAAVSQGAMPSRSDGVE